MAITTDGLEAIRALNPWWAPGFRPGVGPFPHRRDVFGTVHRRATDMERRRGVLLLGPRQVGKSVLLEQLAHTVLHDDWPTGNVLYFNFADDRVRARARELELDDLARFEPPGFRSDRPRLLLLDEIHWQDTWPQWLKRTIDEDQRLPVSRTRVVATDSAASILRQASIESGQGRWDELRIWGLNLREYLRFLSLPGEDEATVLRRDPAELDRYLEKGGFPALVGALPSPHLRADVREDIAERALRRDLLARRSGELERVDVDRVRRLFVTLVQDSSSIWTRESKAADLEAHPSSVTSWLEMLEDACLLRRVEPFLPTRGLPKAQRRLAAKPKIHAAEHGYIPAFTLDAFPMADQKVRDRVAEAVVLRHLTDVVESREDIYYYGDKMGERTREIDFVVRKRGQHHAIEVTSSASITEKDRSRFLEVAEFIGAASATIVHGGSTHTTLGRLRIVPMETFLMNANQVVEEPT